MTQTPSAHHVLAMDTSSHIQVIALLAGDEILYHCQHRIKFNHGSMLLSLFDELLREHDLTMRDMDLLVIGAGPGSFTGLRVGMATAKGLARAANIPLVSASSLEAMAYHTAQTSPGVPVCAAVDARKKEVYAGVYVGDGLGGMERIVEESTFKPDAMRDKLVELADTHQRVVLIERQLTRYAQLRDLTDERIIAPGFTHQAAHGVALARQGRAHFSNHGPHDLSSLEPNYIRPSDAEIQLAKKLAANANA